MIYPGGREMGNLHLTVRQRIVELITETLRSSQQLSELIGVPERHIEDHLIHIQRSVTRDRNRTFVLESSECQDCGFVFRERARLTTPGRCPQCRSEGISPPRFGIRGRAPAF